MINILNKPDALYSTLSSNPSTQANSSHQRIEDRLAGGVTSLCSMPVSI